MIDSTDGLSGSLKRKKAGVHHSLSFSFTPAAIQSFNKYLLTTCYVSLTASRPLICLPHKYVWTSAMSKVPYWMLWEIEQCPLPEGSLNLVGVINLQATVFTAVYWERDKRSMDHQGQRSHSQLSGKVCKTMFCET